MSERDRTAIAEASWRTTLLILVSLPLGVTTLVIVGLVLGAGSSAAEAEADALVWVWAFLTVGTTAAAVAMWRRTVQPHLPASGVRAEPVGADVAGRLQTGLITCLALVEGAALFGGVLLILGAGPLPALLGVILIWTAFFLLRPRREWYGLR